MQLLLHLFTWQVGRTSHLAFHTAKHLHSRTFVWSGHDLFMFRSGAREHGKAHFKVKCFCFVLFFPWKNLIILRQLLGEFPLWKCTCKDRGGGGKGRYLYIVKIGNFHPVLTSSLILYRLLFCRQNNHARALPVWPIPSLRQDIFIIFSFLLLKIAALSVKGNEAIYKHVSWWPSNHWVHQPQKHSFTPAFRLHSKRKVGRS